MPRSSATARSGGRRTATQHPEVRVADLLRRLHAELVFEPTPHLIKEAQGRGLLVVLEARRLLAHSDLPAARIASRLGFADATNFAKYFQQRAGRTPIGFRATIR